MLTNGAFNYNRYMFPVYLNICQVRPKRKKNKEDTANCQGIIQFLIQCICRQVSNINS